MVCHSLSPLVTFHIPSLQLTSDLFFISTPKPSNPFPRVLRPFFILSLPHSPQSHSRRLSLSRNLQSQTLETLEWGSVCKQLSAFTSTSMGFSTAQKASIPLGRSREESQKLLDQTAAAMSVLDVVGFLPSEFSGIEDISGILKSADSGELLTIKELCALGRTLRATRGLLKKIQDLSRSEDRGERLVPLLEMLQNCDFQVELEKKIGFCIDCNLSVVLDRASDELEIIRSEKKRNMENLDNFLKGVSYQIFQAGGIDSPLITRRRGRMCIGIRASYRYLLSNGVILDVSSSGATYFMEPKEAVELNNMDVRLSNAEKAEVIAILSMLTSEIAKNKIAMKYLLDKVLAVDLAFARAAYARWMNGVCPTFSSEVMNDLDCSKVDYALSVNIKGIQHPLLLESSLGSLSDDNASDSENSFGSNYGLSRSESFTDGASDFPVPIDFRVGCGTRVVVISGPNTGGKTASIKTLGLASIMSKAGMYLPAKDHPKLPWFNLVLADIGDHQSLEQNLSTFSGHMSRICNMLEVASKESLILLDEIGGGTDPSEGLALSTSILQYLKNHVNLAVVTTHYVDLSLLKENDNQFENAAMEFSLQTLRPTYRILWGRSGDSNALSIAKTIGFDHNIIERAKGWMERLIPEQQQERKGLLYQSLREERDRLETQAKKAATLHSEIMNLYQEIQDEVEDLDGRMQALMVKETQKVQQEVKTAKSQMETVLQQFENQLRTASPDQFNSLVRKSESAVASIVQTHCSGDFTVSEVDINTYSPQVGEQVFLKRLRNKLATVVEAPTDDETLLVQYSKIKVRVNKSDIMASSDCNKSSATSSVQSLKHQVQQRKDIKRHPEHSKEFKDDVSYGPLVLTSKNSVDLRGMRVEEAAYNLEMAISAREFRSVLFVIHGMGTGAVKERALEMLQSHPRVAKYEQESPMNYGCTVAYIE